MRLTQLLALGLFIVDSEAKRLLELSNEESCTGDRCTGYRGKQNLTKSGKTCQKWTSQSPHAHQYSSEKYPNNGLGDHNYCRNIKDGSKSDTIWCYTTDSNKRWDWCEPIQSTNQGQNNQVSAQNDQELAQTNSTTSSNGTDQTENVEICTGIQCAGYRGKQNVTRSGKTCQKWTSYNLKYQYIDNDIIPGNQDKRGVGDHNYCRNPEDDGKYNRESKYGRDDNTIWCYTTSNNEKYEDWEYCDPIGVAYIPPREFPDMNVVESGMQCEQGENLGFFGYDGKCALAAMDAGYQYFMFASSCQRVGCFGCKSLSTMTKHSLWTVYKLTEKPEISKQNGVTNYTKAHSGMQCKIQGHNLGAFDTAKQCGVAAMDAGCDTFMHTDLYSSWGCRCCNSSSGYQEHYLWNVYSNTKNDQDNSGFGI